jgi:superfamily I DNA/RNA helicase
LRKARALRVWFSKSLAKWRHRLSHANVRVEAAVLHLHGSSADAADWTETLDTYEGLHSIPLMTIHKSKGLEYHTVIFVTLDDGVWWSFAGDQVEATAGFFVAFMRAKQRVVFTYCAKRGALAKIATFYSSSARPGLKQFRLREVEPSR